MQIRPVAQMIDVLHLDICSFVGGNLVTWRSKKQDVVARSSPEAEFRSMAQGICYVNFYGCIVYLKILAFFFKGQ